MMDLMKKIKKSFLIIFTSVFFSLLIQIIPIQTSFFSNYVYAEPVISSTNFENTDTTGLAYGNGTYVAVGSKGLIKKSSDAYNWTTVSSGIDTNYNGITYGNGLFVTVGDGGKIITSLDGITWTPRILTTTDRLIRVIYTGSEFYAFGNTSSKGILLKSADGILWSKVEIGVDSSNKEYSSLAYGNGTIIVGDTLGNTYSSLNQGVSWTCIDVNGQTNSSINFISYLNDKFYLSTSDAFIYYSVDGNDWSKISNPFKGLNAQGFRSLYDGTKYYMFGNDSTSYGGVMTSTDGLNFTVQRKDSTSMIKDCLFANGKYILASKEGLLVSSDGVNWKYTIANGSFSSIVSDGINYFTSGNTSASKSDGAIYKSTDFSTWTMCTVPLTKQLNGIAYGGGKYVAVGNTDSTGKGTILKSTDGTNWTLINSPNSEEKGLFGVAYGNNMFVTVGSDLSIITSTDGETWTSRKYDSTAKYTVGSKTYTYTLRAVSFINGRFVACGDHGKVLYSDNGIDWIDGSFSTTSNVNFYGVASGNDKYVFVGCDDTSKGVTTTSTDLSGYTIGSPQTGLGNITGIKYGGGKFLAISNGSSTPYSAIVLTSIDGENWTKTDSNNKSYVYGVDFINNKFRVAGQNGFALNADLGSVQSSIISPTTSNFDKYASATNYVDIPVTMTLNGNTLSSITNGAYTLVSGTDYTVSNNTVTIKKSYLATLNTGSESLVFNFNLGNTQTLAVTVTDSTPSNSTINPITSSFDKNTSNQTDVNVDITLNGNTLSSITNGAYTLVSGTDYTVNNNKVTIKKSYLATLNIGQANLVFNFNAENTQTLDVAVIDSTPSNSSINPITSSFDKNTSNQTDVSVNITLNGNNLNSIMNGTSTLVNGTDYTVSGSEVTINKTYLVGQGTGTTNLTFKFNVGADQTLAVTVSDTTPSNSTITPTTANFDKYASAANYLNIPVTMVLNGNTLNSIMNGVNALVSGTDYTVSGNTVTINKTYLVGQSTGTTNLTFKFSGGADQTLAVTVADTTPSNSSISITTSSFDKKTSNQADVNVDMTLSGNTLSSITNGAYTLVSGTDYTISNNTVTIKKSYLATLSTGQTNLVFNFNAGNTQTLAVTVTDTTPNNSSISPATGSFDKNTSNQADVNVNMTLSGNNLSSITNGTTTLVSGTDYTVSNNTVTIKKSYLATLNTGLASLAFNFSAGNAQTLAVNITDATQNNSSISPDTGSFDKNTSNQADVSADMTLNGNTLNSIKNGAYTLASGTDYTVSENTVTIKKSYLATLNTGSASLAFNFSAGNDQTLAVTVTDTTPNNSTINPITSSFDKNTSNQADVSVNMILNGNALSSITNGTTTLVNGTDYIVSGNAVTIKKSYLVTLNTGSSSLVFNFNAGNIQTLVLDVIDSTLAPVVPKVASVSTLDDINVENGTAQNSIGLTNVITITLSDSTTTSAAVSWDNGSPTYDGNAAGSYTFTGTLTPPTGIVNTDNVRANVNVIVRSPRNTEQISITKVKAINDINVSNGTTISDIGLPETIDITLSNSTTTSAAVSWDNGTPDYNATTGRTYKFTGALQLPYGVVNLSNLKAYANVIVGEAQGQTTGAAVTVSISGTPKVGNELKAKVVDANGNDLSSGAEYDWYRVASSSGDGDKLGTGKNYMVVSSDAGNYIKLIISYNGKTYENVTSKVTKTTSSTSSSSSHKNSSSSSSSEQITVNVTDGTSATSVSQTVITKTTASDGTKTDTVTYTADKAKETIAALVSAGKDTARIVGTDSDPAVAQTQVNIAKDTLSALSNGNVNLEIETNGAIVSVPKESIQGLTQSGQLSGDLYFRVVPIKDAAKQEAIKTTADKEAVVKAVSGNNGVQVLGTPMTIETNMSQRSVDIVLPLTGITLPTDAAQRQAFLNDIGVFIEHSDGEKVLEKGEVVEYKAGVLGIKFTVNKFSDFTIVKLNQSIKTGWKLTDGYWYFIENDGTMAKGWHKAESGEWTYNGKDTVDTWFHLESNGKMDTGWFKDTDGSWYFLCDGKDYGALGVMETGWRYIDGNWYYFNSNGSMASNTTIDGYTLSSSGDLVN